MTTTLQTASMQLRKCGQQDNMLYDKHAGSSLFAEATTKITPHAISNQSVIFNEPFDFGKTVTATFPTTADLLHTLYFYIELPTLALAPGSTFTNWTQSVGYALIESIELLMGNVRVDIRTSEAMEIESYLGTSLDHSLGLNKMVGRMSQITSLQNPALSLNTLYVPIPFDFTKSLASSLPLFLLSKQRVSIRMKIRAFDELVIYDGPTPPPAVSPANAYLLADFVLMSPDEKALWRARPYEHIFEQWQTQVSEDLPADCPHAKVSLRYSNCVKEIVWVLRELESAENNDWFNYAWRDGSTGGELMDSASILFDGKERFATMPESYYRLVNPRLYRTTAGDRNIYMVSFADKPELLQNTGTANFSRYDDIQLHLNLVQNCPSVTVIALAKSYNTLIIEDGVGRVKFNV